MGGSFKIKFKQIINRRCIAIVGQAPAADKLGKTPEGIASLGWSLALSLWGWRTRLRNENCQIVKITEILNVLGQIFCLSLNSVSCLRVKINVVPCFILFLSFSLSCVKLIPIKNDDL